MVCFHFYIHVSLSSVVRRFPDLAEIGIPRPSRNRYSRDEAQLIPHIVNCSLHVIVIFACHGHFAHHFIEHRYYRYITKTVSCRIKVIKHQVEFF